MDGNNKNGNCYCWPYSLGPFSCCGSGVAIPDWQVGIMAITAAENAGSTIWRNYPDVAMVAAIFTMAARPAGSAPAPPHRSGPGLWRSSISVSRLSTPPRRPPAF
jgi:hypothetical protein